MRTAEINWSRKGRPRQADEGHSIIRYGTARGAHSSGIDRTYVECQCGKTYSGWGHDGGLDSHRKHVRRIERSRADG
jgi:hypothetical protein